MIILLILLTLLSLMCGDIHPNPAPAQNSFVARFTHMRCLRTNFLEHDLLTTRPHMFCVSESFLNSKTPNELFAIPGYSFFRRNRPNDSSWGDLFVFYSDSIILLIFYTSVAKSQIIINQKCCIIVGPVTFVKIMRCNSYYRQEDRHPE